MFAGNKLDISAEDPETVKLIKIIETGTKEFINDKLYAYTFLWTPTVLTSFTLDFEFQFKF